MERLICGHNLSHFPFSRFGESYFWVKWLENQHFWATLINNIKICLTNFFNKFAWRNSPKAIQFSVSLIFTHLFHIEYTLSSSCRVGDHLLSPMKVKKTWSIIWSSECIIIYSKYKTFYVRKKSYISLWWSWLKI